MTIYYMFVSITKCIVHSLGSLCSVINFIYMQDMDVFIWICAFTVKVRRNAQLRELFQLRTLPRLSRHAESKNDAV